MSTNDTTPTRPDLSALQGNPKSPGVLCLNGTYLNELTAWVAFLERVITDLVPNPLRLSPMGPGYRSIACPAKDCRWHTHGDDNADMIPKYAAHYAEKHS